MNRNLLIEFAHVTEAAAIAGYQWLGRGNKNLADGAAVEAMRHALNTLNIQGTIVIGEGEIDDAPMLYIGEHVGLGQGDAVDIAVDPIEGTRMTAVGQANAITVLAAAEAGTLLHAPDMYMEKLVVGPAAKGAINLQLSLADNLKNIAQALDKPLSELTVSILDKPRHQQVIQSLRDLGVRVFTFPDGDVAASLMTCMPDSEVDVMYGIGGAPEGVISAAVIRALQGDMQARLLPRDQVKGASADNVQLAQQEVERCQAMGIDLTEVLTLERMASSDNVIFSATGITTGELLAGITKNKQTLVSETLVICGQTRTQHRIQTTHHLAE